MGCDDRVWWISTSFLEENTASMFIVKLKVKGAGN